MFPGGKVNPRQMERMMKKMGMNLEDIPGVSEVIIRSEIKEIKIRSPSVTVMNVQGERSFQIQGGVVEESSLKPHIPPEDISLVMEQTGSSEEEARKALEESDGEPAEAIIRLMSG